MTTAAKKPRRPARLALIGACMFVLGSAYAVVAPTTVQADGGAPAEIKKDSQIRIIVPYE